ncbi:MAG: hypothetical protein J0L87_08100 [Bacteroidetes bacterium]|nr:hypothetical protein [Bacteroidota bacterium]
MKLNLPQNQVDIGKKEKESIKSETIQLDNVLLTNNWTVPVNLPPRHLLGSVGTLFLLITEAFKLGTYYESTISNNELYKVKKSSNEFLIKNQEKYKKIDNFELASSCTIGSLNRTFTHYRLKHNH